MTILIHIGQRQNSSSSCFTSCGKIVSAFDLSECKQESECKFQMSSGAGAGAGVTFLGTGVKTVTPITSSSDSDQRWDRIRSTGIDFGRILRFSFRPGSGPGAKNLGTGAESESEKATPATSDSNSIKFRSPRRSVGHLCKEYGLTLWVENGKKHVIWFREDAESNKMLLCAGV